MKKILIIILCFGVLFVNGQSFDASMIMLPSNVSSLSANGQNVFRIEAIPADSGYKISEPTDPAPYLFAVYKDDYINVQEKAAYFPKAKKITIRFYVSKHITSGDLRYYIEENDKTKIVDWQPLPNILPTFSGQEFNVYEIKNLNAENRFLKIGIYNAKEPGQVLFQTTSTIMLSKPLLAAIFTFQNNKPDTKKDKEGKQLIIYGSKTKNIEGLTFNSNDIISDRTLFIKTNNAPQLFKLFVQYPKEKNDYMFYEPKWVKLSPLFSNHLEDSMMAQGFNYKAELRDDLLRYNSKHEIFLYYNYTFNQPKNINEFTHQSNKIVFARENRLSFKDYLAISFIFGLPAILAASLFFMWYKNKQKRKLQTQKFATAEAKLKIESIRSQLNPHFIFNALSGIQNLMNKNQAEKANQYLGTFSRLTRNVLDDSNKEMISLDNEIKLLDDYLKMEQLRFGFQYQINADNSLDKHNIEIPAMLLQPFAENAVKHGIASLKENGKINIGFKRSGDHIVMTVTDNGKGFDSTANYNGMGLQLSKNRISLLNEVYKSTPPEFSVNSSPNGTTVDITLQNWLS